MVSLGKKGKLALWVAVTALSLMVIGWGDTAVGLTKSDLRRSNNEGPVEITVVYLNPLKKMQGGELSFEVRMNTHSVDLDGYEMERVSFLRIDGGSEQKALGWFRPRGDGHHISGILKFVGPYPSDAKSLQVLIREIGGVPERVFEWKLPFD